VEISDSGSPVDSRWYTLNGGVNIPFTVNGTIDQNNWTSLGDGPVTMIFYANDTVGNLGFDTVVVNKDAGNPSVSITSPAGGEYFNATAPDFVVEITDSASPIHTRWHTLNGGVEILFSINGTIDQNNWTALGDGPITIEFYANDTVGNLGFDTIVVNKDVDNPIVSITSPTGGENLGAIPPDFVVKISDSGSQIDSMWYTLNNSGTKYYITDNGTIDQDAWNALNDGDLVITFYAQDSALNIGFNSVNLSKSVSHVPNDGSPPLDIITIIIISAIVISIILIVGIVMKAFLQF